ncbi:Bacterial SH3 domain [uncultured Roseburia sp.]|uniref:SH3 domain-containing protein n=1 Tax=Brotonthovivens ammoniilytica TaxID=2981725 RepID=A0ABT2TMT9_9FIRM|nr:SH3 domain-containing protein [Brotonthovivens ammoniilytica]MCU6763535.1 SH3 domain-containing protein [Brotonthovivens ammoniilytica]SCJ24270.1 Bacterial SH3 domain [uncultured Roseburia sp.]
MSKKLRKVIVVISLIAVFTLQCGFDFSNRDVKSVNYDVEEQSDFNIQPRYAYAYVNANGLRVRSSASTSGTIVGLLYSGDKVKVDRTVTNSEGTWCYIRAVANGVSGYVSKQYLSFTE